MPTGYTADLYDGKPQTFEQFALQCARNFGALVLLRDTPFDEAIPDHFETSPYYSDRLTEANLRLASLTSMSPDEASAGASAEFDVWQIERVRSERERSERKGRYEAMLAKVLRWHPPTDDHVGLRDFMVQQLEESIRFDTSVYERTPSPLAGSEWREAQIAKALHDLAYYAKELGEERQRTTERNGWIRALRASLATPSLEGATAITDAQGYVTSIEDSNA